MALQGLAVSVLLTISSLLGVKAVAPDHGPWRISQPWEEVSQQTGFMRFEANSREILNQCQSQPDAYLIFPAVVHGSHMISLDGHVIFTFGDPSFQTMRSFYGEPVLRCRDLASGHELTWQAFSYTKYFARVSFFPYVSTQRPYYNVFAETFHIVGAGVGLMMAIFCFTMFSGRMNRQTTVAVSLSSFFSSFYLGACVAGFMGLPWSMLTTHKVADLGVWAAICLLLKALYHEDLVSRAWFTRYLVAVSVASVIIIFGDTGDLVQFGTTIPFGLTAVVLLVPMVKLSRDLFSGRGDRMQWFQFFSLGSFVMAVFNEMLAVTGLIHSSPMLPFGFMGAVMFLVLAVNVRITATYRERDYLRSNLEGEVKSQTAKLQTAMAELRSTQAELIQSAKLASLGTLSAGIAHEINNSLNYVNGALQPLEKIVNHAGIEKASDRERINKLFGVMKDGLGLTFEIIKGLRTYTGLNQAKLNDVNLANVISSALAILRSRVRGKIEVHTEIPADLNVFGMVVGLNQVFMNLITNALDAMPDGGKLNIEAHREADHVVVRVSDTGGGIPPEILERVFDPFFTTKEVGSGTGLGLHIVKQEVERHKGQVRILSEVGKGTEFIITLPCQSGITESGTSAA